METDESKPVTDELTATKVEETQAPMEQQTEEMSSSSKIAASDFLILVDVNMPKM